MTEINELFDLEKTIAAPLFEGKTYPWEVLDGIKEFILKLGETLSPLCAVGAVLVIGAATVYNVWCARTGAD